MPIGSARRVVPLTLGGGDANAMAEELEPLWLTALLLRVPEVFGCYQSALGKVSMLADPRETGKMAI